MAAGAYAPPVGRPWLIAILAILVAFRLIFDFAAPPFGDEAYYWLWGQRPALSYFDHPGGNAWLLGLFSTVGWHPMVLRLGGLIATAATLPIFAYWARRLAGPTWLDYLLTAAAIWLASPLIFIFGGLAFSDYLLIFLGLLAAHVFFLFFLGAEDGRPRYPLLYAAAVLLGLAGLAKYVAIFIAIAVALTIVTRPRLQFLLRSPHLYLAALLTLAVQTPSIAWSVAHDFPTFRFQAARMSGSLGFKSLSNALMFLLGGAAILSPPLVPALFGYLRRPTGEAGADLWRRMGTILFAVSTGLFLIQSLRTWVFVYWNILAVILFFPLAPLYLRSRLLFVSHAIVGVAVALAVTANYALLPLGPLFGGADKDTAGNYGWPAIAAEVTAEAERTNAGFLAGANYQMAAELGFALHRADIACVGPACHQFDLWPDPRREGGSAILIGPDRAPDPQAVARFTTLESIGTIPVVRFGFTIATYRLYLGTGFHETPAR